MKIAMGCDHGGFALKEHLKSYLTSQGHQVLDCGTNSTESCDYHDRIPIRVRHRRNGL